MLANKEPDFIELSKEMFKQHADETIRDQCRAREDAEAWERGREALIKKISSENETLSSEIETLSSKNKTLSSQVELLKQLLADKNIPLPDDLK